MGRDPSGSSKDRHASDSRSRDAKHKRSRKRKDYSSSDLKSEVSSDTNHSPRRWEPTEEEINEYMAKKAQRKAMKVARKMKTQTVSGYSNDSNPFGDSNLTEKFVWRKKIERDVSRGISLKDLSVKAEKQRQKRRMGEIEKVKKRREERAMEKARREEEMAMLARERARAEFQDWEQKEEEFHFGQSKARAEIRLKEGRAKPIDVLSKNLNLSTEFDVEIIEPYKIYKGLTVKELEELRQDIKMHLELDRSTPTHIEFWEAMMIVCEWEISEARKRDALDRARVRGEAPPPELVAEDMGLHDSVAVDVTNKLERMSFINLEKWQEKIESDMRSGTAKVVEFWEVLLKRLHIYKAKAHLREIHADLLHQHLLRQHSSGEMKVSEQKVEHVESSHEDPDSYSPAVETEDKEEHNEAGSFSPELLHAYEGDEVVEPEADKEELQRRRAEVLEEQRRRLQGAASGAEDDMELTGQERALVLKAMGGMEEGDAILGSNAEVNIESQVYWWHDKYRPRKPKYFNRVHTGYEWNKYNQTHYDHDNPPPKIVQGYKFNIFYPDLVDKSKTPKYVIEADGSNGETCVIRFHAGPPYEDVAFRIVNKEWEYSHKKGFKCTFERGILHVYINFQRYRYRR